MTDVEGDEITAAFRRRCNDRQRRAERRHQHQQQDYRYPLHDAYIAMITNRSQPQIMVIIQSL